MTKELETDSLAPGLSLQEYLAILRRRRLIILQAFVLITVVGLVITLFSRPVYHAEAKLLVDGPSYNLNTVDTTNPLSGLLALSQEQTVETQVEVLQTQPLLDQVTREVGPVSLSVSTVKDTNVIQDGADAGSPRVAADAANRLLELYVSQDADQNLHEIEQAKNFVQTQGALAHRRLTDAEVALKDFKQQYHVADLTKNRDDQIARVTALTDAAQKGQADLAALRAQIAASRALLAQEPSTLPIRLAATNAEITTLRDQIRALQVQREGMTQPGGYTSRAPQVLALDAQIAELQRRLAAQPALTVSQSSSPNAAREALRGQIIGLEAQESAQAAQAAITARKLEQARAGVGRFADWEVAQNRLTRQHDEAEAQDRMFTDKLADLSLREKARHVSARIIERARPPGAPVRPQKLKNIAFAALIGLFVGLCLALLQEFLDDRINTTEDADRLLGLPSLGHVPTLTAADARLLPQMQGLDPAAESYRILRTNIHFAAIDAPVRTLVITSAGPGEGKTTTAANLGFAMAADGRRVILVDTDLRRPSLHALLDLPTVPGLTDVLLGKTDLNDVLLEHADMPGLMALTCGSTPPNPSELLGSRTFRGLVEQMMDMADLVIFDSPPVLAAADAQILASQMDGTIMVVEAGETRKAAARRTLDLLRQARASVLGIAYNKMRVLDGSGYYYHYHHAPLPNGKDKRRPSRLLTETTQGERE
ncbi:MAG: polysaccharide biosynthesis tyrosine autokinase [Armatimonadetes bacterium]|nr:polysaccharide biosynthesis tyrosine autokinase [Armatimonadota bacterium]